MKKPILFLLTALLFASTLSYAKMIDGIAIIVEGEAVTTAEIRAVKKQLSLSKKEAIDILIQDRLQKFAMKDIVIEETLIDKKIENIAAQNSVTIKKMQKILKQQGTSWTQYRESIDESLKKEKFYQDKVIASIPEPTEDEIKLFYNKHKKSFHIPSKITATEYSASSQKKMTTFINTKKHTGVQSRNITKWTKKMDETLLSMFLQTPIGKYTEVMNAGDTFIAYKIRSKTGKREMPFDTARPAIVSAWKQQQQGKALKDYFKKLRTRADIQILR
ncbi:MAG: peptidylprolyl isomerase [Campylobacterota bacterium]|nr:peptidylprolyl isomerase [Campylobacterota bacterium]